ncbi:MAG: hypothetical protein ACRYG8_06990 [Janthinobacterium lividum]
MSDAVSSAGASGGTGGDIQAALDKMTAAFNTAIQTNLQITTIKTEKGAEETAAQQRPNIG